VLDYYYRPVLLLLVKTASVRTCLLVHVYCANSIARLSLEAVRSIERIDLRECPQFGR
jgi:hypothetical protein